MIKTKTPAKLILIGEHAVVHGERAIVIPINLFTEISLTETKSKKISIIQEDFDLNYTGSISELLTYKIVPGSRKPLDLPVSVIQAVSSHIDLHDLRGIEIRIHGNISFKGLGGSSAHSVGLATAILKHLKKYNEELVLKISIESETIFHGYASSGLDQAVISMNKPIIYQKISGRPTYKPFEQNLSFLKKLLIIDSGKAKTSTGESVKYVKDRIEKEGSEYFQTISEIGKLTKELENAIENKNFEDFYEIIDNAEMQLEKLGVVTKNTQKLIKEISKLGGHTKISGAGAVGGKGSGALVCFADEFEPIQNYLKENGYRYLVVKLG